MTGTELIQQYFPNLTDRQLEQFMQMGPLYTELNTRVNVISRKDIDNLYAHHILHSLVLSLFLGDLAQGTTFLDIGTGGGFPGIPLAAMYPDCTFHLIDRIGKKIKVAETVADTIGLTNVSFQHGDVKECKGKYNYVVSRAVMPLDELVKLVRRNVSNVAQHGNKYANGLVCLKGGDIAAESVGVKAPVLTYPVSDFVDIPYFKEKLIVYVPL